MQFHYFTVKLLIIYNIFLELRNGLPNPNSCILIIDIDYHQINRFLIFLFDLGAENLEFRKQINCHNTFSLIKK